MSRPFTPRLQPGEPDERAESLDTQHATQKRELDLLAPFHGHLGNKHKLYEDETLSFYLHDLSSISKARGTAPKNPQSVPLLNNTAKDSALSEGLATWLPLTHHDLLTQTQLAQMAAMVSQTIKKLAPTNLLWFHAGSVAENSSPGSVVGTLQGLDPDSTVGLTYSLIDNANGRFVVNATTGVISIAPGATLDFEAASVYALTARVTDPGGLTYERTLSISLHNVNEAPTSISFTSGGGILEGSPSGTVVATFTGTDPDAGDTLTYSLSDTAGGRFAINATTGAVTVANSLLLDFESATSHTITVRVTDVGGQSSDFNQTINLLDINDAPLSVSLSGGGSITENATNGTIVATFTGIDQDAGDVLTYSLVDSAGGRFAINASTGVLTVANSNLLDYELSTSHTVTVRVCDRDGLIKDTTQVIYLQDVVNNEQMSGQSSNDSLVAGINLESLYGLDGNDNLTGNSLSNLLVGGSGNDTLDGQLGADTLDGGSGNDIYIVDNPGDLVLDSDPKAISPNPEIVYNGDFEILAASSYYYVVSPVHGWETNNRGLDSTRPYAGSYYLPMGGWTSNSGSYLSQTISPEPGQEYQLSFYGRSFASVGSMVVELIDIATGNSVLQETITDLTPNSGYDQYTFTFTSPSNQLLLRFTDTSDSLNGALDNDFDLDSISVRKTGILPPPTGDSDTIVSSITYTIAPNVDVLSLAGSANINAYGQGGEDTLLGNNGSNTLSGGAGADSLAGGLGDDVYIVDNSNDVVTEVDTNLILNGNFENTNGIEFWTITKTGNAQLFGSSYQFDGRQSYFMNVGTHTLSQEVQTQAGQLYNLRFVAGAAAAHSVTITATDDTGVYYTTSFNLTPTNFDPRAYLPYSFNFNGSGRPTTLIFTFTVATGNMAVDAFTLLAANTDRVESSISYTLGNYIEQLVLIGTDSISGFGGLGVNTIWGNAGNNTLGGGQDIDTLIGGLGNDTYYVNAFEEVDEVIELPGGGNDTVMAAFMGGTYTLPDDVENLILLDIPNYVTPKSGIGNTLDNSLVGSKDANTLDGLGGADTLVGGLGNDKYIVDNTGDRVVENVGEGTDTIQASLTFTITDNVEALTLSGTDDINAYGGTSNNSLFGNSGNNTLDGGAGADYMSGGTGNDIYIVDNSGDTVLEAGSAGTDTIFSSVSLTIRANVETLILSGSADIDATGVDNVPDTLIGNSGNNILNGKAQSDVMIGGLGNDTYYVDTTTETVIENAGEGVDTVISTATFTLTSNVEVLMLSGNANGTGNALDNTIIGIGVTGINAIDGGAGADTMIGGLSNDTYVVDNVGDVVIEYTGEGIETITSSVTYTIAANVENLNLSGSANINAFGSGSIDTLRGNTGDNTLDGGAGADTMSGNAGNDTYIVDNAGDVISDTAGTDIILASVSYTLATNTEVLSLTGSTNINATGTANADNLVGNTGDNTLSGLAGADTMTGGLGNDTYVVDNTGDIVTENVGEGVDTVQSAISYTLGTNVEVLTLTGTAALGVGNALDNTLVGSASTITLDGGLGADTMSGGTNNNVYSVDNAGDVVIENAAAGTDTIQSSVTYTIAANVETLSLIGSSTISAYGNTNANTLVGNTGNNTLDGGAGADTLAGGSGNDTYVVDNASDLITEAAASGTDTIQASISFTLAANTEILSLTGSSNINATGTAATAETLVGNSGDNTLSGLAGADTLSGGLGNDTYVVDNIGDVVTENASEGTDTIQSSISYTIAANVEVLSLIGAININATGSGSAETLIGNTGANTLDGLAGADSMAGGTGNDIYVVDNAGDVVTEAAASGTDTIQSSITFTLATNVEALSLTGSANIDAFGTTAVDTLVGNTGNNTLDGGASADSMAGGTGNDTYIVDNASDIVTEAAASGTDTIQASISYTLAANTEVLSLTGSNNINATGTASADTLVGNTGDNTLSGLAGADTMSGGLGNDTYVVDNTGDLVNENTSEGTDTVQSATSYTLTSNVEVLTLSGAAILAVGNALNNTLLGNNQGNTLDGGLGADSMAASTGSDIYIVDNAGDVVTENVGEGTDTIQSSITFTLATNVEALSLTGSANIDAFGTTAVDTLVGNTGNNTLDGGASADSMAGGTGNDTYIVDNASDVVTEAAASGTDTIQASISYTLAANTEVLSLTGSNNINATGTASADTLVGNTGNNTLDGLGGADTMTGGLGDDTYNVDSVSDVINEASGEGVDTVLSTISYTLAANVEVLRLSLITAAIVAAGNALNNSLYGNGQGNTLDGGAGADYMAGGFGNDTYIVDNAGDIVFENPGEGPLNTIQASVSYTIAANVEILSLTGSGNINAFGNANANTLLGNTGANTLDGGGGADSMAGGTGNDTYVVDNASDIVTEAAASGTDTIQASISYTLAANTEVLSLTGSNNISATGTAATAETLVGNSGDNTLSGLAGADTMSGGFGNDTYVVDNTGDVVTENASEGTDTVQSSITYTLTSNVEVLTLTGGSAIQGTGNILDNSLVGNSAVNSLTGLGGNDTLDGGTGADTMIGGTGDDLYIVDNASEIITEAVGEGQDTIRTGIAFTLSTNVEVLSLTGSTNIAGTGNALSNTLFGNSGNNALNGLVGADTMVGGAGDDTYTVDNTADVVTENASEGNDTVTSSVNFSLEANVEVLTLTGTTTTGHGNVLSNTLVLNATGTTIYGYEGNDAISMIAGNNTAYGGIGDDLYLVNTATNVVIENLGEGTDVVIAMVSHTLAANVEVLTLIGTSVIGMGNTLDNTILDSSGTNNNTLYGLAGNDVLDGGSGTDTMFGGTGDDTFIVAQTTDVVTELASEGIDTVQSSISYTLTANVEVLSLTGSGNINAVGNAADNSLFGNTGNNILDGGVGSDTMTGGAGNDNYIVDNLSDIVTENASEGTDTIVASVSFTLASNVEVLSLVGSANLDATGGAGNDTLVGGSGVNILAGLGGNDFLDGGASADTLIGGLGNDTYVVDNTTDVVTENPVEGTDTILSSVSLTIAANVEVLSLTGSTNINATGSAGNDTLTGNTGANTLEGGDGDDVLYGDTLSPSNLVAYGEFDTGSFPYSWGGNRTPYFGFPGWTWTPSAELPLLYRPVIWGASNTGSYIIMTTWTYGNNISLSQNISTTIGQTYTYSLNYKGFDAIVNNSKLEVYWEGNLVATLDGTTAWQSFSTTVTASTNNSQIRIVEVGSVNGQATYIDSVRVVANAPGLLTDTLLGGAGNDTLVGGLGADSMAGGTGNDTYYVNDFSNVVTEASGEGTDLIIASVSYSLTANVENLSMTGADGIEGRGNSLNNTLWGSVEANVLLGDTGNDVIIAGNGNDYVQGDAGNDTLYGDAGNDYLAGGTEDDTLDGGIGTDNMVGSTGNDTYVVDNASDLVTEAAAQGADTIQASVSYTLANNVEVLTLTGSANINAFGTGNNDTLVGNTGNNTLDGGAGADTLAGGTGNDTYVVDNTGDTVTENSGEGNDTIQAIISYTLAANVEVLSLTGSANINATGTAATAETLVGNSGDNILSGLAGADALTGGLGNDTYVVDNTGDVVTEASSEGLDTIQTSITFTISTNVEILNLTGSANIDAYGGTGNDTLTGNSGSNSLVGNDGNDRLDGGASIDTMIGGLGNDSYFIDRADDIIIENAGEGIDGVVISSFVDFAYTLGTHLENLSAFHASNLTMVGNASANNISGNWGNNLIDGLGGNDTLSGSRGNDTYTISGSGAGADIINDAGLNTDMDTLQIGNSGGLARNSIAIFQNGNDLHIAYVGTSTVTDRITITNHFQSGNASRIENITW